VGVPEGHQPHVLDQAEAAVRALELLHGRGSGLEEKVDLFAVWVAAGGLQAALVRAVDLVGEDVEQHLAVTGGPQVPGGGGEGWGGEG
jgi:hypothetical protein